MAVKRPWTVALPLTSHVNKESFLLSLWLSFLICNEKVIIALNSLLTSLLRRLNNVRYYYCIIFLIFANKGIGLCTSLWVQLWPYIVSPNIIRFSFPLLSKWSAMIFLKIHFWPNSYLTSCCSFVSFLISKCLELFI